MILDYNVITQSICLDESLQCDYSEYISYNNVITQSICLCVAVEEAIAAISDLLQYLTYRNIFDLAPKLYLVHLSFFSGRSLLRTHPLLLVQHSSN